MVINRIVDAEGRACCANAYILGLSDGDTLNFMSGEIVRCLSGGASLSFEDLFRRLSVFRAAKEALDFDGACRELLSGNTVFHERRGRQILFDSNKFKRGQVHYRAHVSDHN